MVNRAVRSLSGVCGEVVLACGSEPRYEEMNLRLVLDGAGGQGPLAGLLASMEACAAEWFAVLACDLPRMVPDVPAALLDRARAEELDICMLASSSRSEPLIAVYKRSCLEPIRAAMCSGARRVDSFHAQPAASGLPLALRLPSWFCLVSERMSTTWVLRGLVAILFVDANAHVFGTNSAQ